MDLIMLVNNPRRRERTLKEYRDLLAMAGFRRARVVPPRLVNVVEAIPAAAAMEMAWLKTVKPTRRRLTAAADSCS